MSTEGILPSVAHEKTVGLLWLAFAITGKNVVLGGVQEAQLAVNVLRCHQMVQIRVAGTLIRLAIGAAGVLLRQSRVQVPPLEVGGVQGHIGAQRVLLLPQSALN